MIQQYSELEVTARDYYDSEDADNFYMHIWGGEDIHVGIYQTREDDVRTASRRTIAVMVENIPTIVKDMRILDIGSGYGGAARYLAKHNHCHIDCLNISENQNKLNRDRNEKEGLSEKVKVFDGSFENIPFDSNTFDIVWAQDCIVHSGNRRQVVDEVSRVLRPGGYFIFTDLMQAEEVPDGVLEPVLSRIHLDSMGSIEFYKNTAKEFGLNEIKILDFSSHLTAHYSKVRDELNKNFDKLLKCCNKEYLVRMEKGLGHWIEAGKNGHLCWGLLLFKKSDE